MGYASKYIDKIDNKYFVVMGADETAEGQIWEACNFGTHYKLDNVVAFVDLGDEDAGALQKKFEAFRCQTKVIDGHDINQIIGALDWARGIKDTPAVILAKTVKGKNLSSAPLGEELDDKAAVTYLKSLIKDQNAKLTPEKPHFEAKQNEYKPIKLPPLNYVKGKQLASSKIEILIVLLGKDVAIRTAYGNGLKSAGDADGENNLVMALDGDTSTSTMSCNLAKAHPKKYVECFIAEQNMVSIAQGLSARGKIPFASAFGAFMSR